MIAWIATGFLLTTIAAATGDAGGLAMGTLFEARIEDPDPERARALAQTALVRARHWDDVLTTWRPEGELAQWNENEPEDRIASRDLQSAFGAMERMRWATGGAFDARVGRQVRKLRSDGETSAGGEALEWDAGAIGKGIALDQIAKQLRDAGVQRAFLDFGASSQLSIDESGAGHLVWVTGLEAGSVVGEVRLQNEAISTSRSTPADFEGGTIVDPRSRRPVPAGRVATVLAPSATAADAWSTACIVLGAGCIVALEAAGLEGYYADASGGITSRGFAERLDVVREAPRPAR